MLIYITENCAVFPIALVLFWYQYISKLLKSSFRKFVQCGLKIIMVYMSFFCLVVSGIFVFLFLGCKFDILVLCLS